jgi:hypothetical protein
MKEYLTKFYKSIYTAEAKARYKAEQTRYPILKNHYDVLVPSIVSYEDFWQRHDYRCDINRIMLELRAEDSQSISNSITNMRKQITGIANEANKTLIGNKNENATSPKEKMMGDENGISNDGMGEKLDKGKAETSIERKHSKKVERLTGAIVFLLNDVDDDMVQFVLTLGAKITKNMKHATHALWIPTREDDYRNCRETSEAISSSIPIVDAERWLPRMASLGLDEVWSDIDCAQFLPDTRGREDKTELLGDEISDEETQWHEKILQDRRRLHKDWVASEQPGHKSKSSRNEKQKTAKRPLALLGIILISLVIALSVCAFYPIATIEECCHPARPGTFLELFCTKMGATSKQKFVADKKMAWWKRWWKRRINLQT